MAVVKEWAGLQFRHVVRRNAWVYKKYLLNRLLWNLVTPTITLLAFGLGVGSLITQDFQGGTYLTFLAPGLIVFTTCLAASSDTTWGAFIRMKFQNTFDAQLATPLSVRDLVVGEVVYATLAAEIASIAMLFIAFLLNAPLSPMAFLVPIITLFGGITFASLGLVATAYAPKIEYFTYFFDGFLLPIQFLSGAYFPLSLLPWPLNQLAQLVPLTPVVTTARNCFYGNWIWNDFFWMAIICIGFSLVAMYLAKRKLVKRLLT